MTACIKSYRRNFSSDFSKKSVEEHTAYMTSENKVQYDIGKYGFSTIPSHLACGYCSNEKKTSVMSQLDTSFPHLFRIYLFFSTFDLLFNVYISHIWYSVENYKKPSTPPSLPATLEFPESKMAAKPSTSFVTKQIGVLFMCL